MEAIQKFLDLTIFKVTQQRWWSPWVIGLYFIMLTALPQIIDSFFSETIFVLHGIGIMYIVALYGTKTGVYASIPSYILFNIPLLNHRLYEIQTGGLLEFSLEAIVMPIAFYMVSLYLGRVVINSQRAAEETERLYHQILTMHQSSEQTFAGFIVAMSRAIESKDPYTKGHSERVACYTQLLAAKLEMPPEQKKRLFYGAILHDIGKIGIPDSVLLKAGKLEPDEWVEMQMHPAIGKLVLEAVPGLEYVLDSISKHHESLDGTGYPYGLQGDEIPLTARIIAIADSFDAMTSDRPYRECMTPEQAIQELRSNVGNRYDKKLVEVFVSAMEESGLRLIRNPEFAAYFYDVTGFYCGALA